MFAGSGCGRSRRLRLHQKVAAVIAVVPGVPDGSCRSQEAVTVVTDVSDYSRRSLEVAAVVPDDPGSRRSLEVVAVVPGVPGGS